MTPLDARFAGCLIGQALGDALGFLVEGHDAAACGRFVDTALRPRRLQGWRRDEHAFGQYSDDTQLARELALSLVAQRGFEPADYAARIAALFEQGRVVGHGRATELAAARLRQGVPWHEAGTPAPAAGNGSAMRAAPLGLWFAHDLAALAAAAQAQGRITHADPRCAAGAIAIAGAAGHALAEGLGDADLLCTRLADATRALDPALSGALRELPAWSRLPPRRAYAQIAAVGVSPAYADGWPGISPFVTPSVLWSLYAVLHSPDDYVETVCTAIAVGGDVDTTAAMAGAISGAANGLGAVPADLAAQLTDRGTWGHAELLELACRLRQAQGGSAGGGGR